MESVRWDLINDGSEVAYWSGGHAGQSSKLGPIEPLK